LFTFCYLFCFFLQVLGQHLINLKCAYPNQSEAEVFYSAKIVWSILPIVLVLSCSLVWLAIEQFKGVYWYYPNYSSVSVVVKASSVALLYLIFPGLCSETFAMFSCRDVCGLTLLRVDLDEPCWEGRHGSFAWFLGVPMLICYVIGLPICALIGVWRVHKRAADRGAAIETLDGHLTFGLFYSACKCGCVLCVCVCSDCA